MDVSGWRSLLDLARIPCADDRHIHSRVGQRPGDRQLTNREFSLFGEALEFANDVQIAAQ